MQSKKDKARPLAHPAAATPSPSASSSSSSFGAFSPSRLLMRGFNGVTSPLVAVVKETVNTASQLTSAAMPKPPTPSQHLHSNSRHPLPPNGSRNSSNSSLQRTGSSSSSTGSAAGAAAATAGSGSNIGAGTMGFASPRTYPGLFDISTPSSHGHGHHHGGGNLRVFINETPPGSTRVGNVHTNSGSFRRDRRDSAASNSVMDPLNTRDLFATPRSTTNNGAAEMDMEMEDACYLSEQERAELASSCHHNLHSVLTNPRTNWNASALLDVFYPLEQEIQFPAIPSIPGLDFVSQKDFDGYLKKYGASAKKFEANHAKSVLEQLPSSQVPSVSAADEDVAKCMSIVPSLFFQSTYDFTDPAIFEQVMAMKTPNPLQDELSTYLESVEFALLRQVSSRAHRFFEASANQEVIRKSVRVACEQVAGLRKTMDRLRHGLADKSLDIVSLHRLQKRINELHELVTMIETVKNAESAIEALVHGHDFASALDLIDSAQTTLRDHLKGIHGLNSLNEKLQGYKGFIVTQISQRFISIVSSPEWMFDEADDSADSSDLTLAQADVESADASIISPSRAQSCAMTKEMKKLLQTLYRLDALGDVVGKYRDQLNEEIKVVVKTVVTETIASSSQASAADSGASSGNESKVSIQLRALNSEEFLQCVQMIFEHLLMVLKRATVVQRIVTHAMESKIQMATKDQAAAESNKPDKAKAKDSTGEGENVDANGTAWNPSEEKDSSETSLVDWKQKNKCTKIIKEMEEIVRKTCEFAQRSVSNLFAVRKEVQAIYSMRQLRVLYDTTMDFVVQIEKLTNKTDYTLRGSLFSQLKLFLEKYHQVQINKLVSTLDHELWKNAEISVARHQALEDLSSGRGAGLVLSEDKEVTNDQSAPLKQVSICGKSFRVVWSVLLMLEIVMNYMACAGNFPVLATDVLQRCVEIFRLFNSRTTQLVLGAGAMQIARLKSISARHLDLTVTLIPHIKAALAAHFTDRQKLLLDEFDRVLRDYAEHNEKIFMKLTSIVEEIMKRFLENVAHEVDYDASSVTVPTIPMRGIVTNTLKFHAVLEPVLSPLQMKDIMSRVFDMFTQKLPECFELVQPKTAAGKKKVVEDIATFVRSFSEVNVVQFDGEMLVTRFQKSLR